MIPAAFDYLRAESAEAALAALAEHGDEAKLLAGGHSLLPLMKLRLATPSVIVDIGRISDLSYIRADDDEIAIGALTRHCEVETSEVLVADVPLLAHAAGEVGDPQVRHRGTIGGSIAHGDPASDLPAVLLALRATFEIAGPDGTRTVAAHDFFRGFLETAVGDDEMLIEVRVPRVPDAGWSFQKFNRRAQDWAIVGVAAVLADGAPGVGLVNMGSTPLTAASAEAALLGGASAADAAAVADEGTDPPADLNASEEFRRHLARVLTERALDEAMAR
jgi:carbon-monoxide dehydrogenase medium subunit